MPEEVGSQLHLDLSTHVLEHHVLRPLGQGVIILDQFIEDRAIIGFSGAAGWWRDGHQSIFVCSYSEARVRNDLGPQFQKELLFGDRMSKHRDGPSVPLTISSPHPRMALEI